jgi:hypothetical protein
MKSSSLINAVMGVTKKWAKQRKAEERHESARLNRRHAMVRSHRVTIREAAWEVMEEAYLKASANGTLPAAARQIMYAARPHILRLTGNPTLDDHYFTQTLLPDYIREEGVDWNVAYDARGHFQEPHTDREIALGTLDVRAHLDDIAGHEIPDLDLGFDDPRVRRSSV